MSNDKKDDEMICALTANEREVLEVGLRALPDTMPPRDVWHRIRKQAEAEGLLVEKSVSRSRSTYSWIGLAAAATVAAVVFMNSQNAIDPSLVVPQGNPSNQTDLSRLTALQVQSSQLERELRALPAQPRVARAGTVATMSEIEDRIAAIDYQLNEPAVNWAQGEKEIFWGERVRLMKLLLQLRYAQAQRAAF